MVADRQSGLCNKARLFFYEALQDRQEAHGCQEVWEHIRQCPHCRKELTRLDQELLTSSPSNASQTARLLHAHFAYLNRTVTCREVRSFLPLMALGQLKVSIPTPISVHITHCPACTSDGETIKSLHLTPAQLRFVTEALSSGDFSSVAGPGGFKSPQIAVLTAICQRPESGIQTTFEIVPDESGAVIDNPEDLYAGWPIKVTIKKTAAMAPRAVKPIIEPCLPVSSRWNGAARPALRRYVAPLALAAMMMVACGLFFWHSAVVNALEAKDVYQSLQQPGGLYLAKYQAHNPQPLQEIWLSQNADQYLIKTGTALILWDLARGLRTIKNQDQSHLQVASLPPQNMMNVRPALANIGVVPFSEWTQVPAQAIWKKVENIATDRSSSVDIYELAWKTYDSKTNQELQQYKWRCYWDTRQKMVLRSENYVLDLIKGDLVLDNYTLIKPLSGQKFQATLKTEGFTQGER